MLVTLHLPSPGTWSIGIGHINRDLCRRTAAIRFSRDRMLAEYFALYERLTDAHRKGADRSVGAEEHISLAEPVHR